MKQSIKIIGAVVMVLLLMAGAYYLYDTFRQRSSSEKIADIIHLEDSRQQTSELKDYLTDEDPVVRSRAALAIGRIGAPGSGKLLFDLVTTDVIDVAATAAFALGLTDEKEYASDLLEFALDAPVRVAVAAVEAAGRLSDSSRTDEILMLTGFLDHVAPEVRQAACLALFRAGAKDQGPRLILLLASEPDEEVQIAALYALVRLQVKEAFAVYEEYLADAEPYVRSLAVRGFGLSDSPSAIRYLTIALNDCDRNVVAQAIGELARVKDADAQTKLAKKLQKATDEKLMVALIDALRAQKTEAALETIQEIIRRGAPVNVVCAGVKYLAAIQNDRAVMFIDSMSRLDNPQIKAACAEAYGIIGTRNVIAPLSFLFNDRSSLVRAAAFEELVKLDPDTSQFYLNTALADSDFVLPTLAIGNIQAEQRLSYLPTLGRMMEKGSVGIDIRRALIDCAGAFLDSNKTDSIARQILVRGILDPSYVVRRQAADVYKTQFGEDKTNAVRAAETKISVRQLRSALDKYRVNPTALIRTNRGDFEMELLFNVAPLTVLNFISLSDKGFYDGLLFHRVIPNFVAQGGDPRGDGWGGPDYFIRCEYSEEPYDRGTVGVATSGKDTGGSQFFVALSPQPHLDGRYTVFARVMSGMEIVDNIVMGDTIRTVSVKEGKR